MESFYKGRITHKVCFKYVFNWLDQLTILAYCTSIYYVNLGSCAYLEQKTKYS